VGTHNVVHPICYPADKHNHSEIIIIATTLYLHNTLKTNVERKDHDVTCSFSMIANNSVTCREMTRKWQKQWMFQIMHPARCNQNIIKIL